MDQQEEAKLHPFSVWLIQNVDITQAQGAMDIFEQAMRDERERCAKIADEWAISDDEGEVATAEGIAHSIRNLR